MWLPYSRGLLCVSVSFNPTEKEYGAETSARAMCSCCSCATTTTSITALRSSHLVHWRRGKEGLRLLDLSLQLLWRLLASVLLSMDEDLGWEGRWSLSPTPHRGWSKYLTSSNQPVYYMSDTVTKQFPVATLSEMMSISMWSTVFSFPGVRRRRYLCCSLQATSRVLTTILTVGIARLSNFSFGK